MCGICGELVFDGAPADAAALARMAQAMAPRGPDGSGIFAHGRAGLGHRRLKILDLSERAQQPMVDSELGLSIAFNGCIYNHRALRKELEASGYRFFSDGDTEVIIKAWHAWGPACVDRFHGMFAFALHERDSDRAVLARDRLGIKPLYFVETPKRLRFASTLAALLAAGDVDTAIDRVALHHYMTFHAVVPAPRTILAGVRKLPPATLRVIEPDGRSTDRTYWSPDFTRSREDMALSAEEWRDRVRDALALAVERRTVADVPVGVLLSGGVDSSVITALLAGSSDKPVRTFSIGFEATHGESGDEFEFSDLVVKTFSTDHSKIFVPSNQLFDALPGTIAAMSEPMVSYDNVAFHLLSREVSKHVKVVQSGQGADEVFGGYHWYQPLTRTNDAVGDYSLAFFDRNHERLAGELSKDMLAPDDPSLTFVRSHFGRPGAQAAVDKALRLDTTVMLVEDPVKRVDNQTMAWGLEARVPFLDHELVELAARVPPEHKLRDGGKGVLKDVARMLLPAEVIDRKKGYFPVPALKYLEGQFLQLARDALDSPAARARNLFRRDYLDRLFLDPKGHITPLNGSELWQVALLELWLQQNGI